MLILISETAISHTRVSYHTDGIAPFASFTDGRGTGGGDSHFKPGVRKPTTLAGLLPMR